MMQRTGISTALAGFAVALLALPPGAEAQGDGFKGRKGRKVEVKVEKTDATRGLEKKPQSEKQKKEERQPEITADQFLNIQGKIKRIHKAQIQEYRRLIEDTPRDDPELPELYFRLADLYAQQQRYWRFQAYELYPKIDKAKSRARKRKYQAQQKKYFKAEKYYLTQAIKAYASVANNPAFKNYSKMDAVLFYYAYTLRTAKREELARKVFHKLIKNYPQSKYIADAYLSFADYFFEQGVNDRSHLDTALKFYDKVLKVPQGKHLHAYAQYKKGWVYLNQDRPQDALETFFQVAKKTDGDKKRKVLNKASKKDFVRAYAEVGRAEKAFQAFQRVDRGYAFNMLKILAQLYLSQGKANKTIYTYRELIRQRPKHKEVCDWQYNIVQAILGVGDRSKKVDEVRNLVGLYKKYRGKNILKGHYENECRENAQAITREMAKIWHNEAIKTLNDDILGYAEKLYKIYVQSFPKAEDFGEMEYYYAELLWTRAENEENERLATEKWERAAVAFTDVVKSGQVNDELRKESAYAAVLGWKNALAVDPRTETEIREIEDDDEGPAEVKPREIKPRQRKMIEAFDVYIDYIKNPKDEELVMMKFLKARIYWRHDHLDKALPMFRDIVKNHTQHETARYSVNIVLDSLIRLQQYDEMNEWVKRLMENKKYQVLVEDNDTLRDRLAGIKAKAERKAAEALEEKGEHLECGLAYMDIYNGNPNADDMDQVLYNAGVCFEEAKSIGLAIAAFEKLEERFPDSVQTQKALVRMGNNYGAIAFYRQAAEKYERYAREYGGEEDASKALSNAVVYRKGIGDDQKAIEDIEFFVKQYKRKLKKEAADALFGMTGIYEKRDQPQKVVDHLQRYLREFGARGGRDRVVVAHAKIGQILWEQSCPVSGVNDSCVKVRRERALARRRRQRKGALPKQCGAASKIHLTVINRDRGRANKAKSHFRKAVQAFKRVERAGLPGDEEEKNLRMAQATYWYTAARFHLTEGNYEDFLAVKFPKKLDFDPRNKRKAERSKKRFLGWLEKKKAMAEKAVGSYREVAEITGGGQAWRIAAAARVGQVFQNFADGLYTAEVPRDVRTGQFKEDKWDAYCDQLTTEAAPLEKESVSAFSFCLQKSTQLNWFNQWSKLCEKELGQIRPQDFPTASEVHAEASRAAPITDVQGLIAELQ